MLEQGQYRADVKPLAAEVGLDEPAFEIVVKHMLQLGQPADRATVELEASRVGVRWVVWLDPSGHDDALELRSDQP